MILLSLYFINLTYFIMPAYKGTFPPKHNKSSEFRRIAFREGYSKERFYQLEQWIGEEKSYIYSIDDTSKIIEKIAFIHKFTIKLIDSEGRIFDWYEVRNPENISLQRLHEQFANI